MTQRFRWRVRRIEDKAAERAQRQAQRGSWDSPATAADDERRGSPLARASENVLAHLWYSRPWPDGFALFDVGDPRQEARLAEAYATLARLPGLTQGEYEVRLAALLGIDLTTPSDWRRRDQ